MSYVFSLDDEGAILETVGGKGASLARLVRAGLPVPGGFHVTTAAYHRFVDENGLQTRIDALLASCDVARPATLEAASSEIAALFAGGQIPADIAAAIEQAYDVLAPEPQPVAVRSSATAEDLPHLSFAGQQETFLNVRGSEALLDAVRRCWASLWTARAIAYRVRHAIDQGAVSLAVVVQRMVFADAAGVLFTTNPLNGSRDEVMLNATWGLGEALVSGAVSPDTVVADKASGDVKQVTLADKAVMTAATPDGVATQPVADSRRSARVLSDAQVSELVRLGREIETLYGAPQDVEWCWAGEGAFIVQARPITAFVPPTTWPTPKPRARYMRNNIVELMPDPMTPLFRTLGRRIINISFRRLMSAFLGESIAPQTMIITINDYAYYNGDFSARQIWGILWGSIGIMKRMLTGIVERVDDAYTHYTATIAEWKSRSWRNAPASEVLQAVEALMGEAIAYYGALVGGLIPAAWMSEELFTNVYDRLIKRKDDPPAPVYLLGFDSVPILGEKALFDLARWALDRPGFAEVLLEQPTVQLVSALQSGETPTAVDGADWQAWRERFKAYLEEYGATVYDLDFSKPTPADAPAPVLEAYKLFLREGEARDPYARQRAAAARREQAVQAMEARLKGLRLKWFRKLLGWAQTYAPGREDGLASVGLGYPLLRRMLRDLGQRLVRAGAIDEADDVFWLLEDELVAAAAQLDGGEAPARLSALIPQRKAQWQAAKQATPPVTLPMPPKFLMRMAPAQFGGQMDVAGTAGSAIRGTPCSPGVVTGTARVLHGPQDFDQMQPGDVLVAAITTPAWTPLFALASAIVTDVGGPLSHGSIVAREYGIPAVLGTGTATRRIRSGDRVRVDGGRGTVEVMGGVGTF